jgi:serine/threonine-protein phosphatase 6 catalytic subunit
MWSDPDEVDSWAVSPRGAGWLFGGSVTNEVRALFICARMDAANGTDHYPKFNHVNGLSLIARAHQLVQEGYKYMFDEKLVTVWSAPNYCYRCGNLASILTIRDEEDGGKSFTVYDAAPENERDRAPGDVLPGRAVSTHFSIALSCPFRLVADVSTKLRLDKCRTLYDIRLGLYN